MLEGVAIGDLRRLVGKNLAAHRHATGLSQEAFADRIGYHRTYVGAIERGERNLTLESVEIIAARAEVDVWDLLSRR